MPREKARIIEGNNMKNIVISVVVPVYNEEAVIHESYSRLNGVLTELNEPYELIFVNDGSRDATAGIIRGICEADAGVRLIDFARNFGHQTAITAGMDYASGEAVIVIDADLQDPPEVIPEMIAKWREGFDVVYGQRAQRKGETLFKRFTSAAFYRLLQKLTDVDIPLDTGDFRLIDRKVCDALKSVKERNRYVRGIISWLGFRQTGVEFIRQAAEIGHLCGNHRLPGRVRLPPGGHLPEALHRQHHHRLGFNDGGDPLLQRRYADDAGNHRRVYRQNLRRGQGATALHSAGGSEFRQRGSPHGNTIEADVCP
jgi:glycosyltransferase involved in cell wall biosynthesis